MKTLERGFKAWSERTSVALRRELDLSVDDKLCVFRFAEHLGIEIWTPEMVPNITKDVLQALLKDDPWGWSATSFEVNGKSVVIYNPKHSLGRQSSDIMHEIAHHVLGHQPATVIVSIQLDDFCMRSFDQKQEDEANCLAWTLLLPREGLLRAHLKKKTKPTIAEQFGVTETLVTFRTNTSGIRRQVT